MFLYFFLTFLSSSFSDVPPVFSVSLHMFEISFVPNTYQNDNPDFYNTFKGYEIDKHQVKPEYDFKNMKNPMALEKASNGTKTLRSTMDSRHGK